jgi:hypothetical protein
LAVTEEVVPSAAACYIKGCDWLMVAEVITYRRVEWVINMFAPYKSPGMDGTFLALVQQGWEIIIPYLVRIFHTCLAMGYDPAIWCQVKAGFTHKHRRSSYTESRD